MLTVAGTLIGFGAFGYSVVKLTQKTGVVLLLLESVESLFYHLLAGIFVR